jgi:hypothetical protein
MITLLIVEKVGAKVPLSQFEAKSHFVKIRIKVNPSEPATSGCVNNMKYLYKHFSFLGCIRSICIPHTRTLGLPTQKLTVEQLDG